MTGREIPAPGVRTALVFPGRGAQKAGMGRAWRDTASWPPAAEISGHTGVDRLAAPAAMEFAPAHIPVAANADARPHRGGEGRRDRELAQLTGPVRWEDGVRTLETELGCARFVELGPGRRLTGMIRLIAADATTAPVESPAALAEPAEPGTP
ncbi:hypothetical protein [Streptomyces sp. NPDC019937]|uniref:hypothetical protein n=1 Tax=Streptomyces sp. NPDC019937 TaxID=3154787 RepID=UPI0033FB1B71